MEEVRRPWCKILGEQFNVTPWSDLFGVEHTEKHHRSWASFMDCVTFHLLSVCWSDEAETLQFYISNRLKKPNRVPIGHVQRVQQLNGYLDLLHCVFYSERATKLTKVVEPFNDADLASHILRMVPKHWQDQYKHTGGTVPQSVRKLLKVLEHIKKAFLTKKECKGPKASMLEVVPPRKGWSLSATESPRSPARKQSTVSYARSMGVHRIPIIRGTAVSLTRTVLRREPSQGKACSSATHTEEMRRTSITIVTRSCPQSAKLEKSNKKLKRTNKKRKRDHNSDSDDSNSS